MHADENNNAEKFPEMGEVWRRATRGGGEERGRKEGPGHFSKTGFPNSTKRAFFQKSSKTRYDKTTTPRGLWYIGDSGRAEAKVKSSVNRTGQALYSVGGDRWSFWGSGEPPDQSRPLLKPLPLNLYLRPFSGPVRSTLQGPSKCPLRVLSCLLRRLCLFGNSGHLSSCRLETA